MTKQHFLLFCEWRRARNVLFSLFGQELFLTFFLISIFLLLALIKKVKQKPQQLLLLIIKVLLNYERHSLSAKIQKLVHILLLYVFSSKMATIEDYKYLFKVVLVGNAGVGKTCLVRRFTQGMFPPGQGATIGVDFMIKTVEVEGEKIKVRRGW